MALDLRNGKEAGQFEYERIDAAGDFLSGATAHCIQAILEGVDDPNAYMDACVRMALIGVGCPVKLSDSAVTFSLDYLQAWSADTGGKHKPKWIERIITEDGQRFLSYPLPDKR